MSRHVITILDLLANLVSEKRKNMTEHFWASPILAESHANLAPASIHVAGVDTLTSEGIAYHAKLTEAGNSQLFEGI